MSSFAYRVRISKMFFQKKKKNNNLNNPLKKVLSRHFNRAKMARFLDDLK